MYFVSLRAITQLPLLLDGLWDGTKLAALSGRMFMRTNLGNFDKVLRDTWQTIGLISGLLRDKAIPSPDAMCIRRY
jgi:hypothetical protein